MMTCVLVPISLCPVVVSHQKRIQNPESLSSLNLRIALNRQENRIQATVFAGPGARLTDPLGSFLDEGPATWTFSVTNHYVTARNADGKVVANGPVLRVEPAGKGEPLGLGHNGATKIVHYRGVLEFTPPPIRTGNSGNVVCVFNLIPLETYLRGVIAAEMSSTAPDEALRAQAIVSRSFALKARTRHQRDGFDLTDGTDCQVYAGVEAEASSTNRAVSETAGKVLKRRGELVWSDFYDDCGGVTAPGDDENDFPPSVKDSPGDGSKEYCSRGNHHLWKTTITDEELSEKLRHQGADFRYGIENMSIGKTDASGRCKWIDIIGKQSRGRIKGSDFRSLFGYSRVMSTLFRIAKIDGGYELHGKGYGHGRGMCQCGAIGMASVPYSKTCSEILDHYFPGSVISKLEDAVIGRR